MQNAKKDSPGVPPQIEHEAPATRIQSAVDTLPAVSAPAAIAMAPMPHNAHLPPMTGPPAMNFEIVYEY